MQLNFTTLFNMNYLAKGLALYESLSLHCVEFKLYIFAFDDLTYKILADKRLANTVVISMAEIENAELIRCRETRTVAEYCWTCTPYSIKYCIENFKLDHCTYLDADLYFFKDPSALIASMGANSVLITPHNYHYEYDQSAISGIYCVQFVTFKSTTEGMAVLNWWVRACLDWCYARYEDGKMGDQKYLDSWPYMFNGVYICRDLYCGVAPWNALAFESQQDIKKIIFYHFHDLQYFSDDSWYIGGYKIPQNVLQLVYKPYINLLRSINNKFIPQDTLGAKDKGSFKSRSAKYKLGIYIIDLKRAFRTFIDALFFVKRGRYYRNNFIK